MTIQGLRKFFNEWFCGCGCPEEAISFLLELLELCPLYDNREPFEKLIPNEGLQYLTLYTLDHFDLIEHGTSVRGSWLTDKGKAILELLRNEKDDEFKRVITACCVHGCAVGDDDGVPAEDCLECGKG